jgi:DNA polymerase-3 subunit delta'
MEELIKSTIAYKIFSGDKESGKLSHAYMLYFSDAVKLRQALKLFALKFFGATKDSRDGRLIEEEGLPDLKIYPAKDKKLAVSDANEVIDDSALRPVEGDKKLYIISDFDSAAPIFQNKLLKILEEPPEGVYFLLGASSLSPVLTTIRSRVKLLEIMPFSDEQILSALKRKGVKEGAEEVAKSCSGSLGRAESMLSSSWWADVNKAARELCQVKTLSEAGEAALKFGDTKYKNELLAEMERIYSTELKKVCSLGDICGAIYCKPTYIYALESINKAYFDVKFNANFSSLLYDFLVRVVLENDKWKKLSV